MVDSQTFTKAIDLVKFHNKLNVRQIAERLGVERHIIDNIKRGTSPSDELWYKLLSEFPAINTKFATYTNEKRIENTTMDEPNLIYPFSVNSALSELVETQKKYISRLETENHRLGECLKKMEIENNALKGILSERAKI